MARLSSALGDDPAGPAGGEAAATGSRSIRPRPGPGRWALPARRGLVTGPALLLVAHGTRDPAGAVVTERVAARARQALQIPVAVCYVDVLPPDPGGGAGRAARPVRRGADVPGRRLPRAGRRARRSCAAPGAADVPVAQTFGPDPLLVEAAAQRLAEAAAGRAGRGGAGRDRLVRPAGAGRQRGRRAPARPRGWVARSPWPPRRPGGRGSRGGGAGCGPRGRRGWRWPAGCWRPGCSTGGWPTPARMWSPSRWASTRRCSS